LRHEAFDPLSAPRGAAAGRPRRQVRDPPGQLGEFGRIGQHAVDGAEWALLRLGQQRTQGSQGQAERVVDRGGAQGLRVHGDAGVLLESGDVYVPAGVLEGQPGSQQFARPLEVRWVACQRLGDLPPGPRAGGEDPAEPRDIARGVGLGRVAPAQPGHRDGRFESRGDRHVPPRFPGPRPRTYCAPR
jgi:hypothetical protein